MVFDEVQSDLEAEGYEVTPFLLPACAVNAPHRRDRIWFVAFKNTNENGWRSKQREEKSKEWEQWHTCSRNNERIRANNEEVRDASNTNRNGLNECNGDNEVNSSKAGVNAFGDINEGNGNGDVADTNGIGGNKNDWRGNGEPNVTNEISETRDVTNTEFIRLEHCANSRQIQREKTDASVNFDIGTVLNIYMKGAGITTITATTPGTTGVVSAGVTIGSPVLSRYKIASAIKLAANSWTVIGGIS